MINKDIFVPENTIVYIQSDQNYVEEKQPINTMIDRPDKKRKWFEKFFYGCLPITMANEYGYSLIMPFDILLEWDGVSNVVVKEKGNLEFPIIRTTIANGCLSIDFPFSLRTPPGINLAVLSPFNYCLDNLTLISAVLETDNLRRDFSIIMKINKAGTAKINAGDVIATILPIPRYFQDNFNIKKAEEIFTEEEVFEEETALADYKIYKKLKFDANNENAQKGTGRGIMNNDYLKGRDLYGNTFNDHQRKTR
jgi:hypothetical protein